jgi:hypothetical protein
LNHQISFDAHAQSIEKRQRCFDARKAAVPQSCAAIAQTAA